MIFARGVIGETYLIGSRSERTNLNVVRMICNLMDKYHPRANGRPYGAHITFVSDRLGHDFRYAIDPVKFEHDPGWSRLKVSRRAWKKQFSGTSTMKTGGVPSVCRP